MFPTIYMLVLMVNECSICIYNGTKEFTSISNVLPLIETQPWYIQISTIYHPFLRDSIGNTIIPMCKPWEFTAFRFMIFPNKLQECSQNLLSAFLLICIHFTLCMPL